jgi:hypothetical protein
MSATAFDLLEQPRPGREEMAIEVNFGSAEHPLWESAWYVRRAEDGRFHIVRRGGAPVRVHEHQFRQVFRDWLEINPFPYGRWAEPEVAS